MARTKARKRSLYKARLSAISAGSLAAASGSSASRLPKSPFCFVVLCFVFCLLECVRRRFGVLCAAAAPAAAAALHPTATLTRLEELEQVGLLVRGLDVVDDLLARFAQQAVVDHIAQHDVRVGRRAVVRSAQRLGRLVRQQGIANGRRIVAGGVALDALGGAIFVRHFVCFALARDGGRSLARPGE